MTPNDLKKHKLALKQLVTKPSFNPLKRGKKALPSPLSKLGGARVHSTELLNLSSDYSAFMYWIDGPIKSDRKFFGHLFTRLASGKLSPIFEFHWHPSHKGFHCKMPCKTDLNYTSRFLVGAPELQLTTDASLDPKNPSDLLELVFIFCSVCGIILPNNDPNSLSIWS